MGAASGAARGFSPLLIASLACRFADGASFRDEGILRDRDAKSHDFASVRYREIA